MLNASRPALQLSDRGETTRPDPARPRNSAIGKGDADLSKAAIFVRDFAAIGEGVPTEEETVIFVREFLGIGKAVIRPRIALDWDDLPDAGGGTIINVYRPMFVFDD